MQPILGSFISQKAVFFAKKALHFFGALLNKRKRFSLYFLNGYRYLKNFNIFSFQVQRAINSEIFKKNLMKNKFTLLKIRKNLYLTYLSYLLISYFISLKTLKEKNSCKNILFFKKYKESLVNFFLGKSE